MSADPINSSAIPNDPASWNRYAYSGGDPVNRVDRRGLYYYDVDDDDESCGPDWMTDASLSGPCGGSGGGGGGGGASFCGGNSFFNSSTGSCQEAQQQQQQQQQPTCSISLYTRPAGPSIDPGQHTYLDVTETDASGNTILNDVLEGDPDSAHRHPFWKRGLSWGNLTGYVEPVGPGATYQGKTNPGTNTKLITDTGVDICSEIAFMISDIGFYNSTGGAKYASLPNGKTTFNSNSFTYTLLADVGLSQLFGSVIGWSPGWGFLVPGM